MSHPLIVSDTSPICLVGGGEISQTAFLAAENRTSCFVAVDSGADVLLARGLTPRAVIGDLDSLSPHARSAFADQLVHIAEQATTDFEKALTRVAAPLIFAIGFTGGRLDHMMSVLNVLARNAERPVVLLDDADASFVAAAGTTKITLPQGARISVMPIGPCRSATLTGVVWSFEDQDMRLDKFTSPSNAALGGDVHLCVSDPVLVTLSRDFLDEALTAFVRAE